MTSMCAMTEDQLQYQVVTYLDTLTTAYHHSPNEGKRHKLHKPSKKLVMKYGWPDLEILCQ